MSVSVKKLLSLLVVMAMVVSMIVPMNFGFARAEETPETETPEIEAPETEEGYVNPGQDKIDFGKRVQRRSAEVKDTFLNATGEITAVCPVCAEEKTWTAIDSTWVAGTSISAAGHYYLAEDIDYDFGAEGNKSYIKAGHTVCLNLNGKTVNINAGRFLDVATSRTVSIMDTAGGAQVTGTLNNEADKGSTIRTYSDAASDLHLYGGTFKKADDVLAEGVTDNDLANPAIYVRAGSLNIYEGATLSGAENTGKGGNVFLPAGATLNMYGGVLENGSASHGGNVSLAAGATLNVYAGKILGGTAATNGGNIYAYRNCTLNIYGGIIAGGNKNNVYLDTKMDAADGPLFPALTMAGGTVVGGITAKDEIAATISGTAKVVPAAEGYTGTRGLVKLTFDETQLTQGADIWVGTDLSSSYAWCEACQAMEQWTTISEPMKMEGGHYRFAADITKDYADGNDNNFFTSEGCVDLNGCDVTINAGRFLRASGIVDIMDSQGGAVVTGSYNKSANGAATIVIDGNDADVTLWGGTYKAMDDTFEGDTDNTSSLIRLRNGKLTLKEGATVDASDYTQIGAYDAMYIGAGASATTVQTFDMQGGEIKGGLYLEVTSVTTISGGTVAGGVDQKKGASLALAGAPVITDSGITCRTDVLFDVNGLTEDARIVVNAKVGVPFTTAYTGSADLTGVFTSTLEDCQLSKNADGQFVYVDAAKPQKGVFDPWNFDGLAYCPICGGDEPVLWTAVSEPTTIVEGEHYYFAENLEYDFADNNKNHFLTGAGCINLNGKNVTINAGRFLRATGTTNVMDTAGGAVVTGSSNLSSDEGATIYINSGAKLSLYGGTYKAMDDTLPEGVEDTDVDICAVRVRYGTLNMYDGVIIDGKDYNSGAEALIYVGYQGDKEYAATFNMYGGTIENGSSTGNGGNLRIYPTGGGTAVATLSGGVIQDGTAATGGNIYVRGGTLNVVDAVIQNGEASGNGGNIYTRAATVNVDGGAILSGTAATGGNMYVYRDVTLNISDGFIGGGTGNGSNIYMDVKADGTAAPTVALSGGTVVGGIAAGGDMTAILSGAVKVLPAAEYEGKTYTAADGGIRACKVDTTGLTKGADVWMYRDLALSYTWCEACQAVEAWETATEALKMEDGHYRLLNDMTVAYADDKDNNVFTGTGCIDLNGCDVTVNAGRFLRANGIVNVVDTQGSAVVTGSYNKSANGAATIVVDGAKADVTLYGGTYKAMDDSFEGDADRETSLIRIRNGKLTMKDGATVDATDYVWLGDYAAVYVGAAATATTVQTFHMQGGEIKGGLYLEHTGVTTLSGGTVDGKVEAKADTELTLSGAPVITGEGLRLAEGLLVDISGLTEEAKLNISGGGQVGAFTVAFDGAAALEGVFIPVNGYSVALENNQFKLVLPTAIVNGVGYDTVEEALAAYDIAAGHILTLNGAAEIAEDIVLDVASSENVALSGSGTVYGFDTSNNDYEGYETITVLGDVVVADEFTYDERRYIALEEGENTYGFHRISAQLTHVTLRTSAAGIYYMAEYKCDETLAQRIQAYGVALSTNNMPGADFMTDGDTMYTMIQDQFMDQWGMEADYTVSTTSGSVFGILKEGRDATVNSQYLEVDVYANCYLKIDVDGNGTYKFFMSDTENGGKQRGDEGFNGVAFSLLDAVAAINDPSVYETLSETQKANMIQFAAKWSAFLDDAGKVKWAAATTNMVA